MYQSCLYTGWCCIGHSHTLWVIHMKIKLDDKHWLNSDPHCYWITVEVKPTKSKGKTTTRDAYERRCSYYTATFSEAVDSYIEMRIKGAEIDCFTKLVKEIDDIKNTVKKWKPPIERKR